MKTITLEEAIRILQDCSAVIIDNVVTYPSYSDSQQFLSLSWTDEDYEDFEVLFNREDNEVVEINGSTMILVDDFGDDVELTILIPQILSDES